MYTWLTCTFVFMTLYFRYLGHLYGLGTPGVPASSSPTAEEAAKIEEAWVPYLHIFKNSKRIQNYPVQHSCLKNVAKRYQPCENVVLRHCLVFRLFSPLDPRQCLAPPTFSTECKETDSETRLKGQATSFMEGIRKSWTWGKTVTQSKEKLPLWRFSGGSGPWPRLTNWRLWTGCYR